MNNKTDKPKVIVSMTSFPAAIGYAAKAARSILKGATLPDKLVLYLTKSQFEDEKLLDEVRELEKENPVFEIRYYERDIRSYRKLIPALKDFPDAIVVTVDDDVDYNPEMLRILLNLHFYFPDDIIAHRAKRIKPGKPYKKWPKFRWYDFVLNRIHRGHDIIQTGVAGVLYPPHALKEEMLDEDLFMRVAPTTDDIWFWAAATAKGTSIIPVPFGLNKPKGLGKPKALSLKTSNFKGKTDRNSLALKEILKLYPELEKKLKSNKR